MGSDRPLGWGEKAPWFTAPTPLNPRFVFSSLGGRFVALTFLGDSGRADARAFLETVAGARQRPADGKWVSFGVSAEAGDLGSSLVARAFPPNRVFHDPGHEVAAAYGLARRDRHGKPTRFRPGWFVLDPTLRVYASGGIDRPEAFLTVLEGLPPADTHATGASDGWAPVLVVPRVLERDLCRDLIDAYRSGRPQESGFMRTENGKTVARLDPGFKRRQDVMIGCERLKSTLRDAIRRRLCPEIKTAFQFDVTRIERYIVACYEGESGGFFRAHRDNTTAGTAHRKFAVTINLNAEDHEGGTLRFPEFGSRTYKAPTGGAIVFSCSLLHEAGPVTRGVRYATLPFLYDDEGARIRERNLRYVERGPEATMA